MQNLSACFSRSEEIILNLRSLFLSYGYSHCSVGPFEEYEFYLRNRSALPGENVLIFTDADGRLMALKPDVTMSLVKTVQDQAPGLRKLCYNEPVYRIPAGGAGFRETVQTGLECIGSLDAYTIGEVLMLAMKSLRSIQSSYILNLSHLGILDGLLDQALGENQDRTPFLKAMSQKNLAALLESCCACGIQKEYTEDLKTLLSLYGPLRETVPVVEALAKGEKMCAAVAELKEIRDIMEVYGLGDHIHLDFSIQGGTDYYSGLIFRGFVESVSSPVLSGGRYDRLISRMGKNAGGIGFAVYLDQLGRKKAEKQEDEVLLLYDDSVSPAKIIRTISVLKQDGLRVRADRVIPEDCRNVRVLRLTENGVTELD